MVYILKSKSNFKSKFKSKFLNQMSCLHNILSIKYYENGAAEIAQWVRVFSVLTKDLNSLPSILIGR